MTEHSQLHLTKAPLAGDLVGTAFEGWSSDHLTELKTNAFNGRVGGTLNLENDLLRVWSIQLAPGERLPFHRHVLDYFWTAVRAGSSTQRTSDGTTRCVTYAAGDTRFFSFAHGEYLLHDLENSGTDHLEFVTVELKRSSNDPLPL